MRSLLALLFLALAPAAHAQLDTSHSGLWINPAQSGHGLEVTFLDRNTATLTWFVYDNLGNPLHLVGAGTASGNRLTVPVSINRGMRFGSFLPTDLQQAAWGSLSITFTDCNTARLDWTSSFTQSGFAFGDGSMPLGRVTAVGGLPCGRRLASGTYSGLVRPNGSQQGVQVVAILDQSGRAALLGSGQSILYLGTYTTSGNSLALQAQAIAALGYTFPNGSTTQAFNGSGNFVDGDFVLGNYTSPVDAGIYTGTATPGYRRGASLAAIAGRYTGVVRISRSLTLQVSATGVISGSDNGGCQYAGTISVPDPQWNVYNVSITLSACSTANGIYVGPATLQDDAIFGDSKQLAIGAASSSASLVLLIKRD